MVNNKKLKHTGERLLTDEKNATAIHHLHRYAIALDLVENKTVLDIASGEGYGSHLLSSKASKVIGVDISEEAVEHAQEKYKTENLNYVQGAANAIPLEDNSVDMVVSFETIEHHNDHEGMLSEIKRVLRPNGVLLISSPDKKNYSTAIGKKNPFHVKELYKEEFSALIGQYFKSHQLYDQHNGFHSVISAANGEADGFKEYHGDFEQIKQYPYQQVPIYNICIASDDASKCRLPTGVSTFDGAVVLKQLQNQLDELRGSLTYRIGYFITLPLRWMRRS